MKYNPYRILFFLSLQVAFCIFHSTSFAQFSPLWTQTNNPSINSDVAIAMTKDASGIYVAGYDDIPGLNNAQWRIEKRDLNTGLLDITFGGGTGVVISNLSSDQDPIHAITIDGTGIYVAGYDKIPAGAGDYQIRIEKRDLTTGAPIWTQTNNPSVGWDFAQAITADASGIYVAGFDNILFDEQWRIEKRDLATGNLIASFGTGGVVTNNPSAISDRILAIAADASGIYLAGHDESVAVGNKQWRIEKRDLATGNLIASFGTGGVVTNNPGAGHDQAYAITVDASGLYVAGKDNSPGNDQWRIEKRNLNTGALIWTQTINPSNSSDHAYAIIVDASGIYVAGADRSPGSTNSQWRIEKRDLSTGAVICTQTSNPSTGTDYAGAITVDPSGIYVAGIDNIPGNLQWRIEKYTGCGLPPAVTASGAAICAGSCATLNANASAGTSPYAYSWNSGGQTTSAVTVCPSVTTTYTITITDASSSTATTTVTVTVNPLPVITITPGSATICAGQNATLSANGGISYGWSTSATTTSITVSPTANSSYAVTGTDGNGCSNMAISPVIVEPLPVANAGPDFSICAGQSATLNGSGNGSFSWLPTTALSSISVASPTANPTLSNTYTLTVTNSCGSASDDATLSVTPLPIANAGPDISMCAGSSATLNGSGNGSFQWSPSAWLSNTTIANPVASPTSAITYTLTVTNNCGTATDVMTITTPASPSANAGNDVTICKGSSTTLLGSGAGSFVWANGATLSCTSCQNPVATPSTTTTYTLTISDNCGTGTASVTVTVNDPVVTISGITTICNGSSTTLAATGAISYTWLPLGQTTPDITVNPTSGSNTYTVTGTDADGCTNTNTTTVTVNPKPTIVMSSPVTICNGSSATLTASGGTTYTWNTTATSTSITVNPANTTTYSVVVSDGMCQDTGTTMVTVVSKITASISGTATICNGQSATLTATGGTSYVWSTGAITSSITINPTTVSTYSVLVTSGPCVDSTSIVVTVNSLPTAAIASNSTMCSGSIATLTASGGASYLWNTGAITTSINVSPSGSSGYTVTVTDAKGCTATATSQVTVNPNPTAAISGNTILCQGDNTTLVAMGGGTYNWNSGATTPFLILTPTISAGYTVTVTNVNGCTSIASATISVFQSPVANISCSDTICAGDYAILTASGGGNYFWSSGQITSGITVSPAASTVYTVIVSVGSCADTASCTVIVQPLPVVNISGNITITEGQSTMLTATSTSSVSYSWTPATGLNNPNISNPVTSTLTSTDYCVTVTDALGCTADTCVTVTVEPIDCENAGELYLPNAFSPNGDGENDLFQIYYNTQCITKFKFTIYDRWGEKMFVTTGAGQSWDGKYNGTSPNSSVFVYYLDATLINGDRIIKKGNISLIR